MTLGAYGGFGPVLHGSVPDRLLRKTVALPFWQQTVASVCCDATTSRNGNQTRVDKRRLCHEHARQMASDDFGKRRLQKQLPQFSRPLGERVG